MSLIVKISHSPFGEPFCSEDTLTEVTELSSKGFNYFQFCSLIGQTVMHYGCVKISMHYVADKLPKKTNNINH